MGTCQGRCHRGDRRHRAEQIICRNTTSGTVAVKSPRDVEVVVQFTSNRQYGEHDNKAVNAHISADKVHDHNEVNSEEARIRLIFTDQLQQRVGNGFRASADIHDLTENTSQGEDHKVRLDSTRQARYPVVGNTGDDIRTVEEDRDQSTNGSGNGQIVSLEREVNEEANAYNDSDKNRRVTGDSFGSML